MAKRERAPISTAVEAPTLDTYFAAAHALAALVRSAFDGTVKRSALKAALERFERVDGVSEAAAGAAFAGEWNARARPRAAKPAEAPPTPESTQERLL
jgi:hypothetical protein